MTIATLRTGMAFPAKRGSSGKSSTSMDSYRCAVQVLMRSAPRRFSTRPVSSSIWGPLGTVRRTAFDVVGGTQRPRQFTDGPGMGSVSGQMLSKRLTGRPDVHIALGQRLCGPILDFRSDP